MKENLNHGNIFIVLENDNTDITDTTSSGIFTRSPSNEPTPTKSKILEHQGMVSLSALVFEIMLKKLRNLL